MNAVEYLTENEAATLAGVTPETLHRFSEAGYLHLVAGADGKGRYNRGELRTLFGISEPISRKKAIDEIPIENIAQPSSQTAYSTPTPTPLAMKIEIDRDDSSASQVEPLQSPKIRGTNFSIPGEAEITHTESIKFKRESVAPSDSEHEVTRLKHQIDLLERLLESRDRELADIRRQREWLEERIEKLEQKGEREQLLLLSETQMVRQLVMQQVTGRKSPVRLALDWLGFGDQPAPQTESKGNAPR